MLSKEADVRNEFRCLDGDFKNAIIAGDRYLRNIDRQTALDRLIQVPK